MLKIFTKTKAAATPGKSFISPDWAVMITESEGWKYYSDGTSIGPDGKYYKGSDMIYDPAGMYQ